MVAGVRILTEAGGVTAFGLRAWRTALTTRPYVGETVLQTWRIVWGCLPMVLLVAMFIGANIVVQGVQVLRMLGAEAMVGVFTSLALVRELAPVLGGAMVSAKAGSEIASELASMRTRSQIDAMAVMGVNPVAFLVVPRLIGSIVALPMLTLAAIWGAIGMGWLVGVMQFDLNGHTFLDQIWSTTSMYDVQVALWKSLAFGGTLAVVQTYFGFRAEHGPQGVGMATNRAVVYGAVLIGWLNLMISAFAY